MAVAEVLKIQPSTVSVGIAVDNVVGLIYFPVISYLGQRYNAHQEKEKILFETTGGRKEGGDNKIDIKDGIVTADGGDRKISTSTSANDMEAFLFTLTIGLSITAGAEMLTVATGIPAMLLSTLMSIVGATLFSKQLKPLIHASDLMGKILLLLFVGNCL